MDGSAPAGNPRSAIRTEIHVPSLPSASLLGSLVALVGATCCILPMVFVLMGVGGAWLAIFSPIVSLSPYLLGGAAALVLAAWISVRFRPGPMRIRWVLGFATTATVLAHAIYLYRDRLTDLLMGAA